MAGLLVNTSGHAVVFVVLSSSQCSDRERAWLQNLFAREVFFQWTDFVY